MTPALQVHAGPVALRHLREHGLRAQDVRLVAGAAGGPKGLVLGPLDRYLFGRWLPAAPQTIHLVGASIGAWRMATAALPDPVEGFERLSEGYVHQRYEVEPGRLLPTAAQVSLGFSRQLQDFFAGQVDALLAHPRWRLHVVASRGRHLLGREGRWRTPIGYLGAAFSNALSRRALGAWMERVVFSSPGEPLPLDLSDLPHRFVPLVPDNFHAALQASCSIPFAMQAVHAIPGAPPGAYWDGGLTDYHLHWNYRGLGEGLVVYPHFQQHIVPGWLDKAWKRRHVATRALDNVVVLAPSPAWVATLPGGKLPDRTDFKRYAQDLQGRVRAWSRVVRESERLADDFDAALAHGARLPLLPL